MCIFVAFCVQSTVFEAQITRYERDTVELACHTDEPLPVDWEIRNNPLQGNGFRRIYSTAGFLVWVEITGRYSISIADGFYNLSITNLTVNDTGDYVCNEDEGNGPASTTRLDVLCTYYMYRAGNGIFCSTFGIAV